MGPLVDPPEQSSIVHDVPDPVCNLLESDVLVTEGIAEKGSRGVQAESTDRKSTRLNSSHTVISYAVFCLKKKKKKKNRYTVQQKHRKVYKESDTELCQD